MQMKQVQKAARRQIAGEKEQRGEGSVTGPFLSGPGREQCVQWGVNNNF